MIPYLLLLCSLAAGVRTLEVHDAEATSVVLHATVSMPEMTPHYQARLEILADTLAAGSANYPELTVRRLTGAMGSPLRGFTTPGALHLTTEVPAEGWQTPMAVLAEALTQPTLNDQAINEAISARTLIVPTEWATALQGVRYDWAAIRPQEVRELAATVLRPERVLVVVAGGFEPKTAAATVSPRFAGWTAGPQLRLTYESPMRSWFPKGRYLDLIAAPQDHHERWPVAIVAATTLGGGKDCTMFRTIREEKRWSYRQEAFLSLAGTRFALRCVVQQAPGSSSPTAEELRQALLEDVAKWDKSTLDRAKGLIVAVGAGRAPMPVQLGARGRAEHRSLSGRALLAALWFEATGSLWSADEFVERCLEVDLDSVRSWTKSQLEHAVARSFGASG